MRVLISQQRIRNKHDVECDGVEIAYYDFIVNQGIWPVPVPNLRPAVCREYLDQLSNYDGIILSGGNNICPQSYGHAGDDVDCSMGRDNTEMELMDMAIARRLPVLGICRGMQFLNTYFGGSLVQDISAVTGSEHAGAEHDLVLTDTQSKEYLGVDSWRMMSYHNQGVLASVIAPDLRVFAVEPKGDVVEGLYHHELPIAGIQFHPEREKVVAPFLIRLIQAFKNRELFWG